MHTKAETDPLQELLAVQKRMNRLFDSAFERSGFGAQNEVDAWSPVADVFETPASLVVCLELPGLEQDRIDVRVEGDELVVAGEREMEREREGERFHRVERAYGKFARRFRLPSTVDRERIDAVYRDGLLRIELRRRGESSAETIRVAVR